MLLSFAGVIGIVLLLMIPPECDVTGLFKEKLYENFDSTNATFVDPSTSGCNIIDSKRLLKFAHLAWLKIWLAPVLRWNHRHGAAIDDITRI